MELEASDGWVMNVCADRATVQKWHRKASWYLSLTVWHDYAQAADAAPKDEGEGTIGVEGDGESLNLDEFTAHPPHRVEANKARIPGGAIDHAERTGAWHCAINSLLPVQA